jgi:hypothetical protein
LRRKSPVATSRSVLPNAENTEPRPPGAGLPTSNPKREARAAGGDGEGDPPSWQPLYGWHPGDSSKGYQGWMPFSPFRPGEGSPPKAQSGEGRLGRIFEFMNLPGIKFWVSNLRLFRDEERGSKMTEPDKKVCGVFKITWMEQWDEEFINSDGEGYFRFEKDQTGEFQFGYVYGEMDCRHSLRDGKPFIEFSFQGNDENDPASGRGWAVLDDDELKGQIFFHQGDDSEFKARRVIRKVVPHKKKARKR